MLQLSRNTTVLTPRCTSGDFKMSKMKPGIEILVSTIHPEAEEALAALGGSVYIGQRLLVGLDIHTGKLDCRMSAIS